MTVSQLQIQLNAPSLPLKFVPSFISYLGMGHWCESNLFDGQDTVSQQEGTKTEMKQQQQL